MLTKEARPDSVVTSSNLSLKDLKAYDILIEPSLGSSREPGLSFSNTEIIFKSTDRISTTTEPQEPVKPFVSTIYFHNADSQQHLDLVRMCEKQFDNELQIDSRANGSRSYNVVHDLVNFELAKTSEQAQAVKSDMLKEGVTNLRERYRTLLSVVTYVLDENGMAYSEDDTYEPVDIKFQRGALYRIEQGSKEPERELQTVAAAAAAKRKLVDSETPLHSKMIVISPPSEVVGTIYTDNFVDIFESDQDFVTGQKLIRMFRFASATEKDEYREIITKLKSDSNEVKGGFDVWCLSNPIFIDSNLDQRGAQVIFHQEFKPQEGVIKEDDFQEIISRTLDVRENYIEEVFKQALSRVFNPREIVPAFNTVLNKADEIREEIINRGRSAIKRAANFGRTMLETLKSIKDQVAYWGYRVVKTVMGPCGSSEGYSTGGSGRRGRSFWSSGGSSASSFDKDQYGSLEFECPKCKKTNRRSKGKLIPNCQHCKADVRC